MMKIMPVAVPLKDMAPASKNNIAAGAVDNASFKDLFDKALQNLNDTQLNADETIQKFLTGEVTDLHTVIIALEKAKLSMQLAVEVRNKLIEAYQEISRMQV